LVTFADEIGSGINSEAVSNLAKDSFSIPVPEFSSLPALSVFKPK
jgi:hypothetical protein